MFVRGLNCFRQKFLCEKTHTILQVDGECGEYSLAWGYWDYCLYKDSSKPDYVGLNWKEKQGTIHK